MAWLWAMRVKFTLLIVTAFFYQGCSSHFFYPDNTLYRTPAYFDLKYEDVYFTSKDDTPLHAWHIYPKIPSKGLLFVAHGNAQNLSSHFVSWVWLIEEGYELFIFDYRAYGKSKGTSTIKGSIEDTKAALNCLEGIYKEEYVVVGQSLGGTMLLNALSGRDNTKIKSVVIDSTFTGFSDIASAKMKAAWLTWPFQWIPKLSLSNAYDAKDRVGTIDKPLLFIHGSLDRVVSVNESWVLFELSKPPKELWIIKDAEHTQGLDKMPVRKDFLYFLHSDELYYDPYYSRMKIYE